MGLPLGKEPSMSDLQEQVQEAIDRAVSSGAERGVQVAAYRGGEPLVQAVAGVADPETGRPVTPDTPFYNFSIVKGAASTVAHVLAERGLFGYDTPGGGAVAGVRGPRQGGRDRAARPEPFGRRARDPAGDDAGGPVQLGPDVRGHRRC